MLNNRKVAYLVHHTYDFPSDASYAAYAADVADRFPGKATWMSVRCPPLFNLCFSNLLSPQEICCSLGEADGTGRGWSGGYDPTIANALMRSGMVYQSIIVAG